MSVSSFGVLFFSGLLSEKDRSYTEAASYKDFRLMLSSYLRLNE